MRAGGPPRRPYIIWRVKGLPQEVHISDYPIYGSPMYQERGEYQVQTTQQRLCEIAQRIDPNLCVGRVVKRQLSPRFVPREIVYVPIGGPRSSVEGLEREAFGMSYGDAKRLTRSHRIKSVAIESAISAGVLVPIGILVAFGLSAGDPFLVGSAGSLGALMGSIGAKRIWDALHDYPSDIPFKPMEIEADDRTARWIIQRGFSGLKHPTAEEILEAFETL